MQVVPRPTVHRCTPGPTPPPPTREGAGARSRTPRRSAAPGVSRAASPWQYRRWRCPCPCARAPRPGVQPSRPRGRPIPAQPGARFHTAARAGGALHVGPRRRARARPGVAVSRGAARVPPAPRLMGPTHRRSMQVRAGRSPRVYRYGRATLGTAGRAPRGALRHNPRDEAPAAEVVTARHRHGHRALVLADGALTGANGGVDGPPNRTARVRPAVSSTARQQRCTSETTRAARAGGLRSCARAGDRDVQRPAELAADPTSSESRRSATVAPERRGAERRNLTECRECEKMGR